MVLRVYYENIRDLAALQSYDLWEYNNPQERYVLVSADLAIYDRLIADGWIVAIDTEATAKLARSAESLRTFFGDYRTVDELYADLAAWESTAPSLTEVVDYGQSYCLAQAGCTTPGGDSWAGFPLRAIRLTNEVVPGSSTISGTTVTRGEKPVFFLMAGIHSREITTPEIAMRFVRDLLDGYGTNADATWLIDHHEIWVVPTTNPDGHWLVELGATKEYGALPFFQRKNGNNDVDSNGLADCPIWPPSSFAQFGIDLNRNHSFGWGPPGSSNGACDMTYRGPAPASENEVAALETLIAALFADHRGPNLTDPAPVDTPGMFITLHSFGDLVLWPWGHIEDPAPNMSDLKAIGDKFATFNGYLSCQPSLSGCLYASNGASDDFAYGELGVPAYTFEIGDEFMPPYGVLDDEQWPDNKPALLYAAKIARTPYLTVHGPDVLNLTLAGTGQELITVTATIDDTMNGGHPIASAHYTIDTPPWSEDALFWPFSPADGEFSSPSELVTAEISTEGMPSGRHIFYVRGQDSDGNWGPVSAAFFHVMPELTEDLYLPVVIDK